MTSRIGEPNIGPTEMAVMKKLYPYPTADEPRERCLLAELAEKAAAEGLYGFDNPGAKP